uniref:Cilia- and flagella-associated protein 299 n=1 Tax=Anas platyrhynchos TaxID=8839 RepID=A0A8B9T0H6_ANAPL
MILLHQQSKYVVINLISCWWKSKVWNLKFIFVHTVNLVFLYKHDLVEVNLLLASTGKELKDNFLQALAEREEANRDGKLSSIIYIRDYNSRHQEVSAYIDYAYRLTTDDFEAYFSGKKRLLPRKTDLSFYNWNKNVVSSNPSPNYEVIAENSCGLLFKNKMDGKIINVNPKVYPGDNTTRTPVKTNLYLHMVIYDHIVGREP